MNEIMMWIIAIEIVSICIIISWLIVDYIFEELHLNKIISKINNKNHV